MNNFAYSGSREPKQELVEELLLSSQPQLLAVDVETVSLENPEPVGIGIAISPDEAFYFYIQPEPSPLLADIMSLLRNPAILKIYHNALYDLAALAAYGLEESNIVDTLIIAHLAGVREADLQTLAASINITLPIMPKLKHEIWEWSKEQIAAKCCTDAMATFAVYEAYKDKVDAEYLKQEVSLIPILLLMSSKGIRIDQKLRFEIEVELEGELILMESVAEDLGFNPGSPKQVGYMLAKAGIFLPFTRKRKNLRTDEETLARVNHPIAALTLHYRGQRKYLSTYIEPLAGAARCYTRFHLDAITGRITSTHRNLQNIPKGKLRNIFLPDSDVFTDLDFSQIELRVLAHFSQDKRMKAIFEAEADIHQATADFLEIRRGLAKNTNFAMIYGATDETIAVTAGITDIRKAAELRSSWGFAYPQAMSWIEEQQRTAMRAGNITTLYGRKIPLPSDMEESVEGIRRKAVNYPIQASAAEIVKRAMLRIAQKEEDLLEALRLQVHDELLFDGNVVMELDKLNFQHISPLHTPYEVKMLERWE